MRAINAHIHLCFCREHHLDVLRRDFWDIGHVQLSFWRVPVAMTQTHSTSSNTHPTNSNNSGTNNHMQKSSLQRRPVGIRTLPYVLGPRTGEGLFPGDIVEIVQIVTEEERDAYNNNVTINNKNNTNNNNDNNANEEIESQRFLRLAGDRGWVFESHPTVQIHLFIHLSYLLGYVMLFYIYLVFGSIHIFLCFDIVNCSVFVVFIVIFPVYLLV